MKQKRFWSFDVLLLLLALSCVVLAVLLCISNPAYLLPAIGLLLFLVLLASFDVRVLRRGMRRLLGTKRSEEIALARISLPAIALRNHRITWYSDTFKEIFAQGEDVILTPVSKLVQGLDLVACAGACGQEIKHQGRYYTVYASDIEKDESYCILLFVDNTEIAAQAQEYVATRPAVLYIEIDSYDDILKQMRESERTGTLAWINTELEAYFENTTGLVHRVNSSRFIAIIEQRDLEKMLANKFPILDTIRNTAGETTFTLSIGVGYQAVTFRECEERARQALDMALGRGGDQAAVKSDDGFVFYGGVTRSVERRTRIKSRMVANAIRNLVVHSKHVLIMGHKQSDMDSLGAAIGMLRFCKICGIPASIALQKPTSLAGSLIQYMEDSGYGDDVLPPEVAMSLAGAETLLVVVDTHVPYLLESEALYRACGNVVVIDHHRKMIKHIDNAVVFYHEPYASSASELVSELLMHVAENRQHNPTSVEAEALLAGIMLDTRTFSLHVGVRTFEAAAYLRRMGAHTEIVKSLFASTLDDYMNRTQLVSAAEILNGCAIVVSDNVGADAEVIVAQAANDLLTIEGVKASFVAIQHQNIVRISARSMGDVNVQVIMEQLGGGGHLTMAGAQVKGFALQQVREMLVEAIQQSQNGNIPAKKT